MWTISCMWHYLEKERNKIDFRMIIKDCNCYHFLESIHSHALHSILSVPRMARLTFWIIRCCCNFSPFSFANLRTKSTNDSIRMAESSSLDDGSYSWNYTEGRSRTRRWHTRGAIEIFNQFRYIGAHDRKQFLLSIVNHHDKFRVNDERGNLSIVRSKWTHEYEFGGWLNENFRVYMDKRLNRFE